MQDNTIQNRTNPFFVPYNTPHDTVPFERIRLEDYEPAFMEESAVMTRLQTRL